MEHIRSIDVARSLVVWAIVLDVVVVSLKSTLGILGRRRYGRATWRLGIVEFGLVAVTLFLGAFVITLIALSAPAAWLAVAALLFVAAQAGVVLLERRAALLGPWRSAR